MDQNERVSNGVTPGAFYGRSLYEQTPEQKSWVGRILGFCIYNKLVVGLITLFIIGWGIYVAPFDWHFGGWQRNPVAVDAIPDIGENQQIVFTDWPGQKPAGRGEPGYLPFDDGVIGYSGYKGHTQQLDVRLFVDLYYFQRLLGL